MFFKVNSVKVSIAEYLYEGGIFLKPLVLLIAVFVKLLRIPIPGSTDIPPVRSLVPFQTTEEELPTDIVSTLTGLDAELQQSGFELTDALSINHTTSNTQYASLVYLSANGDCVAWLRDRRWPQLSRSSRFPRVTFYSRAQNGKVVMTTSADRDLLDPPDWDVEYKTRLPVAELLQAHRMHLSSALGAQRPQVAANALAVLEDVHHQFVEFQTGRGVFFEAEPEPVLEVTPAAVVEDDVAEVVSADSTSDDLTRDPVAAVVEQVRRLETNRTQWVTKLIVLLVSVAVFVGLGAAQWDLTLALMLVPILFVHELGHYIAMVVFGYKNVQMFYIPLLGAAVTGRHYHVAGWRKAVVSLAGPLPSIVLGFLLGVVGIFMESEWIINASILTLILNAFNLLPFLPLDGGWVAHVTLFARSQWLDLLFRIGTVVTLLGVSRLLGERILMFFGIAMAIGIPIVWKTIKATEIARQRTIPEPTDDQIPELAIRQLVSVVQEAGIPAQSDKQIAQAVVNVYESMMTKPPSWPATLGIWALHVGGVLLALIGFIGLTMASLLRDQYLEVPEFRPQYVDVGLAEGQFRLGSGPLPATDLLMWEYPDDESARGAFEQLRNATGDSTARLGRLVLSSRKNEAGVRDLEDFDFELDFDPLASEADYVIGLEREARADVRFSDAPPASRQRMFRPDLWGYPSLLVSFAEPQQAEQIINAMLYVPDQMGDRFPIVPWTPRREINAEQQELRHLLAILQNDVDEYPWQIEEEDADLPALESFSAEDMQALAEAGNRLNERNLQRRIEWIESEQQTAAGAKLELLRAYSRFESDLQSWRDKLQAADPEEDVDWSDTPDLAIYLEPILEELGYLDRNDEMQRFAAMASASPIRVDDFEEPPPLSGSLVQIDFFEAQDAAAAIGGAMAWLKQNEATGLVWRYDEAVLPEDKNDDAP